MPDTKRLLTAFLFIVGLASHADAQNNPDDYWLNHGFTNGGTVITNTGNFYDDGGNELYGTGQNWSVTFCSENGNPITFDFNGFRTDYRGIFPNPPDNSYLAYDYLRISTSLQNVVAYNDDTPQFSFTDPDGCITFSFVSQSSSLQDSGWIAEISANPPPINNDPCASVDLAVGNVSSPGFYSNKGSYNTTNLGSPSCHRYFGGDVWFTATVPESGQLKIETYAGSLTYAIMALYTGDCSNLTEIQCVDDVGSMPSVIINRSPGETIYIRIFGDQAKSGTFGISATDPTAPVTGFTGPGGVGDSISNRIWLKGDQGTLNSADAPASEGEAVQTWLDMSGNANDFVQSTVSSQPSFNAGAINSKPTLSFDGTDDFFTGETGSVSAPLSIFTVNTFDASVDQTVVSIGDANDFSTTSIAREADNRYYAFSGSKHYGPVLNGSTPYILDQTNTINSPFHELTVNASDQAVDDYSGSLTTDGSIHIGASRNNSGFLSGELGELIIYEKQLNQAQEIIINNYLAAKYGIDIQSADRYDYESTHPNDVAGIGRIDATNMHSKAQSAGILSIGGPDDLEDNEFLMFGHDGGDINAWVTTEIPGGDVNLVRLAREWRVDHSGGDGVGSVSLGLNDDLLPALPAGYLAYNLFVDDDGDFSSGAIDYGLISSGDELIANNVTLSDGAYITIMAVKPYLQFASSSKEGEESVEHPVFEVSLNYAISDAFEVDYSVSGGTATPGGVDFSLNDGTLVFNPGTKTNIIQPLIIDDDIVELPDEYFTVEISNPTAGVLPGDTTTLSYTIIDNDVEVQLAASDTLIGECSSGVELYADANGREPLSFNWTPSAGLDDPANDTTQAIVSGTTLYTLRVTDARGNFVEKTIEIEVVPAPAKPVVSVSGSLNFCSGDSAVLSASDAYAYLWSNGDTTKQLVVKSTGKYYVKAVDEYGCASAVSDTISIEVFDLPAKPLVTASGDLSFCEGDSVELSAPASDSYLWSTGETTQTIKVKTAGSYYVRVYNSNSCESPVSEPVEVLVHSLPAKPVITYSGSTEFCQGESIELTAPASESYSWSNGETTQAITVSSSGSYTLEVSDVNSCISPESDPVNITVNDLPTKPVITVTGDTEFCEGASVELTAPLSDSYNWSNGETTRSVTVTSSGTYTLTVSDANSCTSPVSDPVDVTVHALPAKPAVSFSGSNELCAGESLALSAPAADSWLWSTGETTQNINVNTTGSYTVRVRNSFSCTSPESDPVDVTVHDLPAKPVISVNGSTEFCSGSVVELSAPASDSYLWSTGEITQSITVSNSGSFSVTVTDANSCTSPQSDPVEVTVHDPPSKPVISYTGNTNLCEGESLELTAPVADSYLWSTGETTRTISVNSSGSYTVNVSDINSCTSPESDPVEVTVHPLPSKPVISLSGSNEICAGESVTLSAPAADSYLWSTGEVTQEIIVSTSGSYTVSVANQYSCVSPESDPEVITINDIPEKPVISVTGDTEFCEGSTVELTAPVADSYLWSTGETTRTISVNSSGSYTVNVSDINSCTSPASDPVEVTVHPLPSRPVISLSGSNEICAGESVTLSAPAADSYLWSTGEVTQEIIVSTSGSYTVSVADQYSCVSPESDPEVITVNDIPEKPVISVTGDTEFCEGSTIELTAPVADSYLWSTGETTRTISVNSSGSYTVNVSDINSCTSPASDPVEVMVHPLPSKPVISLSGSNEICAGESVTLSAPAADSYLWSTGEVTQEIIVSTSGSYTVSVADQYSCVSPESDPEVITVNDIPEKPVISVTGDTEFCEGSTVELTAPVADSYLWSTGETTRTISVNSSGSYTVNVSDINSCTSPASDPVEVSVHPVPDKPEIVPPGPLEILSGDSVLLATEEAASYLWSDGSTSQEIYAKEEGGYSVKIFNSQGCESPGSDPVEVIVTNELPAPEVDINGNTEFCEGGSVELISEPASSYLWSTGETSRSITISESGTYQVRVENGAGVSSSLSDPVEVVVHPSPSVDFTSGDVSCYGDDDGFASVIVNNGTAPYSFDWSNGESAQSIDGLTAGEFEVQVEDANSCTASGSVKIEQPSAIRAEASITPADCPEAVDGAISLSVTGGTAPYMVSWADGSNETERRDLSPDIYEVTISDNNGCTFSEKFDVDKINDVCFRIPDIITPNNDGHNDTWQIQGLELYPGVEVEIYDRWGKRVFYSEGYDEEWDGTSGGQELPMESYHYIINLNNGTAPVIGNVTIVR